MAVYQLALQESDARADAARSGRQTQVNLCRALARLGEREAGTRRLEEAIVACQLALQELTRDRVPLDWAETQIEPRQGAHVAWRA